MPAASAFNLHYLLHVLWAFLGARLLASRLSVSPPSALFAGAAYAFSGMMLSYGSAFFNSSAAAAWLPWCAAAALAVGRADSWRGRIRASTATGLAFGLQLLAGEPAISLLTGAFTAFLCLVDLADPANLAASSRKRIAERVGALVAGGIAAGAVALAFAAALLLPLRAVFPLTYRGQHLYSETAFGAAPFLPWRVIEWLFPRFNGDPSAVGSGAGWLAMEARQVVYIWCVTLGVLPLLAVLVGMVSRGFWRRTTAALAAAGVLGWLFSLGLSLPLLPRALRRRVPAAPALSDQVLPDRDDLHRSSRGVCRRPLPAGAPQPRRDAPPRPGARDVCGGFRGRPPGRLARRLGAGPRGAGRAAVPGSARRVPRIHAVRRRARSRDGAFARRDPGLAPAGAARQRPGAPLCRARAPLGSAALRVREREGRRTGAGAPALDPRARTALRVAPDAGAGLCRPREEPFGPDPLREGGARSPKSSCRRPGSLSASPTSSITTPTAPTAGTNGWPTKPPTRRRPPTEAACCERSARGGRSRARRRSSRCSIP